MFDILTLVNIGFIILIIVIIVFTVYIIKKQYEIYDMKIKNLQNDLQTLISEVYHNKVIENEIRKIENTNFKHVQEENKIVENQENIKQSVRPITIPFNKRKIPIYTFPNIPYRMHAPLKIKPNTFPKLNEHPKNNGRI